MSRKRKLISWAVGLGIIAGIMAVLLGGCNVAKKHQAAKFERLIKRDSVIVRVDSVHTDTVTVFGQEYSVDCDSIVRAAMDDAAAQALSGRLVDYKTKTVVKWKTPIETFIFDTVWQVKDHYVENTAKVELLQKQKAEAESSHAGLKGKLKMWRGITIALFVLLLLDLLIRKGKTVNVRA